MKYENFDKAKVLVEKMRKEIQLLEDLQSDNISIKIHRGCYTIQTIGVWADCEHHWQPLAEKMVENLRMSSMDRIAALREELEKL